MHNSIPLLLTLISISQFSTLPSPSLAGHRSLLQNFAACPLTFDSLRRLPLPDLDNTRSRCHYIIQGLRLVLSEHLRRTGSFLPSPDSAEPCWDAYGSVVGGYLPNFDIRRRCGFRTDWISRGCMNLTSRSDFEAVVPPSALGGVSAACNQSLLDGSPCASCTTALSNLHASYLPGPSAGNLSDCTSYPFIYAAAFSNRFGPSDPGTAACLFNLDFESTNTGHHRRKQQIVIIIIIILVVFSAMALILFLFRRRKMNTGKPNPTNTDLDSTSLLDSLNASTSLIHFTFDEIKTATRNFSRHNIIGTGGYGYVFKGTLPINGSEVALKRFKNCSASGDASFTHELLIIASVRHVNLVALRGYCTATTPLEGHQRIIVCDLMKNGSLHDHLFGSASTEKRKRLDWPVRHRIAIGTARGLAYLHYGAQPAIIHRDIKASNILLDENFEPKVADFGLAKFRPDGMTHLSTRVAGTMGYVAPEYALYGQLTEKSDVYSFGVVLLELLSGKKAILSGKDGQPYLVGDWAWALVRKGRALDVVEKGMPDLGPREVVERFVLVGVLCSHPQAYARPTMDRVVKMLEMDVIVPGIPERPISLIANMGDIERSVSSSSGSGNLSTRGGYQAYTFQGEDEGDG
ncbi:Probable LRR receptor-like serine/threonine-protein kinase RKF3 [Striga hermonthica]|uniref:non-specific serine/threonine protein kinase n=1 Tax=Striga hermonthica TaxID=68872 RepID=A0A9N7RIE5_STRHE|nr:Probable LRR receptor-like serine/threonine-protein kinase RKF3 [Striga hermonthica]